MEDLIYVAVVIVFFVLAGLFVVACDKIIGPDDAALEEEGPSANAPEPVLPESAAA